MIPKPDEFTIVAAGSWNPAIVSPPWLEKNVISESPIVMQYGIGAGTEIIKFICGDITIVPRDDRLVIGVSAITRASLDRRDRVAMKLLELLPHTPIQAVGINFGFTESDLSDKLSRVFTDTTGGLEERYGTPESRQVHRSFDIDDTNMNFRFVYDNETVQIHHNIQVDKKEESLPADLLAKIVGEKSSYERLNELTDWLTETYDLTIEHDEENDP